MYSLAIDPSVNNVGWSIFNSRARKKERAWKWGTIYPEGGNLQMRIMDIVQKLDDVIDGLDIAYLITEHPAFFSSEKGQIAAHMNYTIDLAAINFFVAGWWHKDHRTHYPITATQWKGSVAKAITERKFLRCFPNVNLESISEHAIDSVMLHRYWIENYAVGLRPYVKHTPPECVLKLI